MSVQYHMLLSKQYKAMAPKRDLSDLISILQYGGIWLESTRYSSIFRAIQIARIWFVIIVTPFTIASMYFSGFKVALSKYAFYVASGVYMSFQGYLAIKQFDLLKSLVHQLKSTLKKRQKNWEIEIFKQETKLSWFLVKGYLTLCTTFTIAFQVAPLVYEIFLALFTDSKTPFVLAAPLDGFITSNTRSAYFYFILFTSNLWGMSLTAFSIGTECSIFVLISYICSEFKVISSKILEWGKFTQHKNTKFGSESEVTLKEIILEHQEVLSMTNDLKEVFGLSLALQNTVISLCLTLVLYTVIKELKKNLFLVFLGLFCVNGMTSITFSTCYMGQKLQSDSLIIFEKLCSIPWYEMAPAIRKELILMYMQSQKSLAIHYRGRNALNLMAFMRIINASYSYLMVLRTTI